MTPSPPLGPGTPGAEAAATAQALHDATTRRSARATAAVAGLAMAGVAIAATLVRHARPHPGAGGAGEHHALASYLRDHLAGADTAIEVVAKLSDEHHGTAEGTLSASLHGRFQAERDVVTRVLDDLQATPVSAKRVVGKATGAALRAVNRGDAGALSLFRTLEALAVGIQGKRLLWRALQRMTPRTRLRDRSRFAALESDAVKQWKAVERWRQALISRTFAG